MIPLRDDNPSRTKPVVTIGLIGACVLVFLWQFSLGAQGGQRAIYAFGLIPAVLFDRADLPGGVGVIPPVMTVLSSMFMHGGFMHLAGNMLYLWIFGDNVEDSMGHGRFLAFYVLCGIAAALSQAVPNPLSQVPMVGASGAISGVLGAYLLLYPNARVLVLVPIGFVYATRLSAALVLALWFGLQLLNQLMTPPDAAGVAFRAHIGGFVAGLALIPLFKHRDVPLFSRR